VADAATTIAASMFGIKLLFAPGLNWRPGRGRHADAMNRVYG